MGFSIGIFRKTLEKAVMVKKNFIFLADYRVSIFYSHIVITSKILDSVSN